MEQQGYSSNQAIGVHYINAISMAGQADASSASIVSPTGLPVTIPVGVTSPTTTPQLPHYQYDYIIVHHDHTGVVASDSTGVSQPSNFAYNSGVKAYDTSTQQSYNQALGAYSTLAYAQYSSDAFSKPPPHVPHHIAGVEAKQVPTQAPVTASAAQANEVVAAENFEKQIETTGKSLQTDIAVTPPALTNSRATPVSDGAAAEPQPVASELSSVSLSKLAETSETMTAMSLNQPSTTDKQDTTNGTSLVPQLRTAFESAKFWLQCAENASRRASELDPSIGSSLHTSVLQGIDQFLLSIKHASQTCIDDATKHVPELSLDPSSLMPPLEQASIDDAVSRETHDVKPDTQSLPPAIDVLEVSLPPKDKVTDDYQDTTVEENDDDDDDYFTPLSKNASKKRKSRRANKLREPRRKAVRRGRPAKQKTIMTSLKCADCDIDFTSRDELTAHMAEAHPGKSTHTCDICFKSYASARSLKKHTNEVHNKQKQCNLCDKRFAYKYELDNHRASKHKTKEVSAKHFDPTVVFQCGLCEYSASRLHNLKSHIRFKHAQDLEKANNIAEFIKEKTKGEVEESQAGNLQTSNSNVGSSTAELVCMLCNKIFSSKRSLHQHLKTHVDSDTSARADQSTLTCKRCSKQFADVDALFAHMRRKHKRKFNCKFCLKQFDKTYLLEAHLRYHLNLRPYRCDVCTTGAFPSLTSLRVHTRRKHPLRLKQKPYHCVSCQQAFTFRVQLRQHNERCHTFRPIRLLSKVNKPAPSVVNEMEVIKSEPLTDCGSMNGTDDITVSADTLATIAADATITRGAVNGDVECHRCVTCSRTFSSLHLLREHVKRVHRKHLRCGQCSAHFSFVYELREHVMTHSAVDAFACDYCEERFQTPAAVVGHANEMHAQQLDNNRFRCTECAVTFPLSVSLTHHMKMHEPYSAGKLSSCDACLRMFPSQLRLTAHRMANHDIAMQDFDSLSEDDNDVDYGAENHDDVEKQNKPPPHEAKTSSRKLKRHRVTARALARGKNDSFVCRKCGHECKTMDALSEHKLLMHSGDSKLQCPACDKVCPNKEALRNHKRRVHGKKRSCKICSKKFPFQYALEAHMLTHTGERNYTCMHCKKTFYTIQQLNVHVKLVHSGRSFSCHICGTKFGTKQGRDRHIQHRHSDDRPQTCEYCGRGFVDRRSLKAHIFIHTRQSDIVCEICNRMFGTRSCLNKHIRIQHKGERKLCPICGKHIAGALSSHLKSHGEKRYKCTQCDKVYAWPQGLKEHLRTHSGDKPYHCTICNKRFLGSANFSKHKKIHQKTEASSRRKAPAPQKIERRAPEYKPEVDSSAAEYADQYQAMMNQLMFSHQMSGNPGVAAAAMMQQQVVGGAMLGQAMLSVGGVAGAGQNVMTQHHEVPPTEDIVFPNYIQQTEKYLQ